MVGEKTNNTHSEDENNENNLTGVILSVISDLSKESKIPFITGGFINTKKRSRLLWKAGQQVLQRLYRISGFYNKVSHSVKTNLITS